MTQKNIFYFRVDLRLFDNPGLFHAAQLGNVLPIYILDDSSEDLKIGSASKWWLHNSLSKLNETLSGKLNLYQGNQLSILLNLIDYYKIEGVYWNRRYEPAQLKQDSEIKAALKERGIKCKSFNGSLIWEPWEVLKDDGTPYRVFTPFYRKVAFHTPPLRQVHQTPARLELIQDNKFTVKLEELNLLPKIKWYESIAPHWTIGEEAAQQSLSEFLTSNLSSYKDGRNIPSQNNTSHLSPHLHYGEISPNQIWEEVEQKGFQNPALLNEVATFLTELGWREFSYYLLYHYPTLPEKNLQEKFDRFPWRDNKDFLNAWKKGRTGYPMVDAGMRELWQTGYMHNRVRMIVASFLVKNMMIDWRVGAKWFMDCLLDADLASNSVSWQWVAGSGMDSAPYFRIFNPVLQGEKFDKEGSYIRKFIPELKNLPDKYIFAPWTCPELVLDKLGIVLGKTYPNPIVDLKISRKVALEAYSSL